MLVASKKANKRSGRRFVSLIEGALILMGGESAGYGQWQVYTTGGYATFIVTGDNLGYWVRVVFSNVEKASKVVECSPDGVLNFESHGDPDAQAAAILSELSMLNAG